MIIFDELRPMELPPSLEGKAGTQVEKSLIVWRVGYVPRNEAKDHTTLGYFGLVPVDYIARVAYLWLHLEVAQPPRKALQEAKRAFAKFSTFLPWSTYIYTELHSKQHRRFAEFMGYRHILDLDGYHFFERGKDEH